MAIPLLEPIAAAADEWDALADAHAPVPFARPWWAAAWSDAFAGDRPVRALTVRHADGTLRAAMPVQPRGRRVAVPGNAHWPYLAPVADGDDARAALARALVAATPGHVRLGPLRAGDPFLASLRSAAGARRVRTLDASRPPVVPLGPPGPHAGLSRHARREIERCLRRLGDAHGDAAFAANSDVAGARGAFDALVALEDAGWKGRAGTSMGRRPRERAFYARVVGDAAARGAVWVPTLSAGGAPLAAELDLIDGGAVFSLKGAYDPALARLGPGHMLMWHVTAAAAAAGLVRYETLGADEPYKRRWSDRADALVTVDVVAPTPRGVGGYALARVRPLGGRMARRGAGLAARVRPLR